MSKKDEVKIKKKSYRIFLTFLVFLFICTLLLFFKFLFWQKIHQVLISSFSVIPILTSEKCLDGKGSDIYFEKTGLLKATVLASFSPKEIVAQTDQLCSQMTYQVMDRSEKLKKVSEVEFELFVSSYNQKCQGCLLVSKFGWPYSGEIYKVSTNELICDSGIYQKRDEEKCLNLVELMK